MVNPSKNNLTNPGARNNMPPGIPESVPDEIADRIYDRYGNMKALSRACNTEYQSVYSALTRSSAGALKTIVPLASSLGVTAETLAEVLSLPDLEIRKNRFLQIMHSAGFPSLTRLAAASGVTQASISRFLSASFRGSQINVVWNISSALGISLVDFRDAYRDRAS